MKEIPGYPGYFATPCGAIFSNRDRRRNYKLTIMKQFLKKDGYLQAQLRSPVFGSRSENIHRLVALAYLENPEKKETINHKIGVKKFNFITNLEWATRKENSIHCFRFLNPKSKKLTEFDVRLIRLAVNSGLKTKDIAKAWKVSTTNINHIKNYINWKHVKET